VLTCGVGVQPADAAAISFSSTAVNTGEFSVGFEFDVLVPVEVTALGFYDYLADGLAESHAVGIYDSSGTLLLSGTVVPGDPLIDGFRYTTVAPFVLAAGAGYRIAAVTGADAYAYNPNSFAVDPAISYVRSRYTASSTLVFPTGTDTLTGYFGPNFEFEAVPEPATLLLVGIGLGAVARRGVRRPSSR
jgi:hypothetical protein